MKISFLLCCALVFFAGCVSQDTTKLRVGMTKAEVLAVMGPPESVGAEGRFEYLNYRVTAQSGFHSSTFSSAYGSTFSSSSSSMITQSYTVRLADGVVEAFGLGSQISYARPFRPAPEQSAQMRVLSQESEAGENGVRIVSITPASAPVGKPAEFKVRIAYALKEAGGGSIKLGFNINSPRAFHTVGTQLVSTGTGELEAIVKLEPKDWGQLVAFTVQATLTSGRVLAHSKREIVITK